MNPEQEELVLNPRIKKIGIGKKTLRYITIYPLAVGEQSELEEVIGKGLRKIFDKQRGEEIDEISLINSAIESVKDNLDRVLELVTEDEKWEILVNEITNEQVIEIAEAVWDINYAALRKKVQTLLKEVIPNLVTQVSGLGRLSQLSAESTDIDLETSTESPGEKEASH